MVQWGKNILMLAESVKEKKVLLSLCVVGLTDIADQSQSMPMPKSPPQSCVNQLFSQWFAKGEPAR